MNRILFLLFFFVFNLTYGVSAEILDYTIDSEIDKKGRLTVLYKETIKINSHEGQEYGDIRLCYNGGIEEINDINIEVLSLDGEKIKSYRKKDIKDLSVLNGYYNSGMRYKHIEVFHDSYPYIIQLSYTEKATQFYSLPFWDPHAGKNLLSYKSTYRLKVPEDYSFHYKFFNFKAKQHQTKEDGYITYEWNSELLSSVNTNHNFLPPKNNIYHYAEFYPDNFVFGNVNGRLTSWNEFGHWQSKLNEGLQILPEDEKTRMNELTSSKKRNIEKARTLYKYLQDKTRYVGDFEGFKGWKSFDATYVSNNKYGDCKALSNYMMSMLKVVGIKSYYSLISSRDYNSDVDSTFVSHPFNHVVLFVPLEKDSLWLECTSQKIPFNYWGTHTNGKHALVCDYENSRIVKSPQFDFSNNYIESNYRVTLEEENLQVESERKLFGEAFENILFRITDSNDDKKSIYKALPYENFSLNNIDYLLIKEDGSSGYKEKSQFTVKSHLQKFGNYLAIKPFITTKKLDVHISENRDVPIFIKHSQRISEKVDYKIPVGYKIDALPKDLSISIEFATVKMKYTLKGDILSTEKNIELRKGNHFDFKGFKSIVDFVKKNEKQKILLSKL